MDSKKVFEVPAVYKHDRPENLRLVLENLSRLERITDKIFTNVENQIESFQKKLIDVQDRTRKAKRLVDALKQRKQATTVLSPSVLPKNSHPPPKLFQKSDQIKYQCFKIVPDPVMMTSEKLSDPRKDILEKYTKNQQIEQKKKKINQKKKMGMNEAEIYDEYCSDIGLGEIPDRLSTVSSLLVFNSNSNCYVNYDSDFDALQGEAAARNDEDRDSGGIDEPPPASLTGKVRIFEYENVTIGYKPQVKELPKFDEIGLGLDNVADVTSWGVNFEEETSIIPSSHLPNLPPVQKDTQEAGSSESQPGPDGTSPAPPPPPPEMGGPGGGPAPPPPPPPIDDNVLAAPAPPPIANLPVSPGLEPEQDGGADLPDVDGAGKKRIEPPDERQGLLAAIRNFKLNKLTKVDTSKHVTQVNVGRKKKAGSKKAAPQPTLLEQLRARIAIRRDAMEGKSKGRDKSGGGGEGGKQDDGSFGRERIKRPDLSEEEKGGRKVKKSGKENQEEEEEEEADDDGGFGSDDDDGSDWSDED